MIIIPFPELAYGLQRSGFSDIRTYASYESRQAEPLAGKDIMVSARKPWDMIS